MILKFSAENRIRIAIVLFGFLIFCSFNGLVRLFDWDEINFAESAREMIVTGNYNTVQINFTPFWEKPPLYIWFQVLSMKIFGINEFAARFPNAVCGVITLLVLFEIGREHKSNKFGLFWVMAYGASILPFLYFKSGIIDPWFNLFIFISLYYAYKHFELRLVQSQNKSCLLLSAVSIGLAVLTKGPVAILLFGITMFIYILVDRKFRLITITDLFLWGLTTLFIGGAYHIYQLLIGNSQLIVDFFKYQVNLLKTEDAGHGGSLFYHPVVLFVGVFPSSILALLVLFRKSIMNNFGLLMVILFWVVLIIFSLVKTKIVHYSSLCYFPISFLAATAMYQISIRRIQLSRTVKTALFGLSIVYVLIPLVLQLVTSPECHQFVQKYVHDDFALACLNYPVTWNGKEFLVGAILLAFLLVSLFFDGIKKLLIIYSGTIVFVLLFLLVLLPKIEAYSQGAAIGFIEGVKKQKHDACISSLFYKSYATLFYAAKAERACFGEDENECLLYDLLTTDCFFIVKVTHLDEILKTYPQLEIVKKEGGFVLLRRIY